MLKHGHADPGPPEITMQMATCWRKSERDRALETLRDAGTAGVRALVQVLRRENGKPDTRALMSWLGMFAGFAFVGKPLHWSWVIALPLIVVWYALTIDCAIRWTRRRRLRAAVAEIAEVDALDVLLDADVGEAPIERAVWPALRRLLPRLTAADAAALTPVRLSRLSGLLDLTRGDVPLQVAIIETLQRFSDGSGIGPVRRLAKGRFDVLSTPIGLSRRGVLGPIRPDRRAREAAAACMAQMEERAKDKRTRDTLLRGSAATAGDAPALLRPGGPEPGAVETLLRTADAGRSHNPHESGADRGTR